MHLVERLERVAEKLCADLIEMHKVGAIELEYWENARLLVELFYDVKTKVDIGEQFGCRCRGCYETRLYKIPAGYCDNNIGVM